MMNSHLAIAIAVVTITAAGCAETGAEIERDPQSIRAVVREHTPEIRACYDELLQRGPNAEGRVVARFMIQASGEVSAASIETDELTSPELEICMLRAISSWTFPVVEGDGVTTVTYPFTFRARAETTPPSEVGLGREAIRRAFAEARSELQRCYERGLLEVPELEGRVTVRLTIDEDGAVSELDLSDSTLESDDVIACLEARLSTLAFPAHRDGAVTVTYPLIFASNE